MNIQSHRFSHITQVTVFDFKVFGDISIATCIYNQHGAMKISRGHFLQYSIKLLLFGLLVDKMKMSLDPISLRPYWIFGIHFDKTVIFSLENLKKNLTNLKI